MICEATATSDSLSPKPDEEREKEAHRHQAAKLARIAHQEAGQYLGSVGAWS
jgi:hypothetical protein